MKKKKRNLIIVSIVFCIITLITVVIAKNYVNTDNRKIPFLPLDVKSVNYIGLYGGTHRNATEAEKIQIVNWLNSIEKYEKTYTIPVGNGKPDRDNIQIFIKDFTISFSPAKNSTISFGPQKDGILIASSEFTTSRTGYIVKQADLSALLKQIQ